MNVDAYLNRIGYDGKKGPTVETLRLLHLAHMMSVPFENLDIHIGRPIVLDLDALFEKIVLQRRGGFCYELNGLFACLLEHLGFTVDMLSARVAGEGRIGPDFDHMTLLVHLEEQWLADVGFGESFREPLKLHEPGEQVQHGRAYRIIETGDAWRLSEGDPGGDLTPQYFFTLQPRKLSDFTEMCVYQQTSPDSHFTRKRMCSLATPTGRITLSGMTFITTEGGKRGEQDLTDGEYASTLQDQFGIVMPLGRMKPQHS